MRGVLEYLADGAAELTGPNAEALQATYGMALTECGGPYKPLGRPWPPVSIAELIQINDAVLRHCEDGTDLQTLLRYAGYLLRHGDKPAPARKIFVFTSAVPIDAAGEHILNMYADWLLQQYER